MHKFEFVQQWTKLEHVNIVWWWAQTQLIFEIKLNEQTWTFNTWLNLVYLQP